MTVIDDHQAGNEKGDYWLRMIAREYIMGTTVEASILIPLGINRGASEGTFRAGRSDLRRAENPSLLRLWDYEK